MKTIQYEYYMGDFETTVYDGQTSTEVWASAVVKFDSEDVKIFHSIEETFNYLKSLKKHICIYYHNLRFDGNFWLSYLMNELHFKQASNVNTEEGYFNAKFILEKDMKNNTFKYSIISKSIVLILLLSLKTVNAPKSPGSIDIKIPSLYIF